MERIDASASGRVEVAGRWFGVRGRRFMRPALTISGKDGELRALADLDDKPWAAEDGELWRAAFSVEAGLGGAREIELAVAPDIVIELRAKGRKLASPGATLAVGQAARAPRAKEEPPPPEALSEEAQPHTAPSKEPRRPPSRAIQLERLGARLASANQALEQERERRAAMAKSLEQERTANRQLRTDLGRARSELEIAAAAQAEAAAIAAELEAARGELREAQRRHDALARQHEEATQALIGRHDEATGALTSRYQELSQAHAAVTNELHERAGALESTRQALAEERAESGRLRNRLSQVQEARQRTAPSPPPSAPPDAEPRVARRASSRAAAVERRTADPATERRAADPAAAQRFDIETLHGDLHTSTASAQTPRPASHRGGQPSADSPAGAVSPSDRLRPLNPSLRHRTYWFGRLLALLVLLGVIAAVWLVLHSTVLH